MTDGIGLAEAMLGLDGFRVLEVVERPAELVITIESTVEVEGCRGCGRRARSKGRDTVAYRELACFGRPVRLLWNKRRWRCPDVDCDTNTWVETSNAFAASALMTDRAAAEACRQVGEHARSVSSVAEEFGVCWWTVMDAVTEHGTRVVDDPARVGRVAKLGVDETSFLKAKPNRATQYMSSVVDLDRHVVIDLFEGNAASDLRKWCSNADRLWLRGIEVVATDLTDSYRAGMFPYLAHATRVADAFHVVRVGNRCLDQVRRRVQTETLGHRGRKHDPLFKIRKIMLTGAERLDERGRERMMLGLRYGDPHDEVLGAWLAKESVRDVFVADDPADAETLLDKAIAGCLADDVEEIRSLGKTLKKWRTEILAARQLDASNGPTEGLNLLIKKVKRCGHGYRNWDHYRLRVLLHTGGVTWPTRPAPPRIRTRSPRSNA